MRRRRLEYSVRYFRRLGDIYERIASENPSAARRVVSRIRTAVDQLSTAPGIGRPGRVAGTREPVVVGTPYVVPYRVEDDAVQIITVLHGAEKWPDRLP